MVTMEIKLKIHEESDMFVPYDPDQQLLSHEVSEYLIQCYENKHRKNREDYIVHIYSDTPVNEEHVIQAIRGKCGQESGNNKHEIMLETFRELMLVILGLVFLSLWFFTSSSSYKVLSEVFSIVGCVAITEAASIAIVRRPKLYVVKKTYEHAMNAPIIIDVAESEESGS